MDDISRLKEAVAMALREYESAYEEGRDDYLAHFDAWVAAEEELRIAIECAENEQ